MRTEEEKTDPLTCFALLQVKTIDPRRLMVQGATYMRRLHWDEEYSLYLDNCALDNSSFLLIVQNLVSPEWNGLSHSKIVLVNRSRYSG